MPDATNPYDTYTSPLAARNASPEMLRLWSPRHKFNTWRRVWLAVAEAQHELGLPVSKEQVEELRAVVNRPGGITDEEMHAAEKYERDLRHDVMAHVHALGDSCPNARPIIHLGMTSQDVNDNADLMILDQALQLILSKCVRCTVSLAGLASHHASTPALAFTHYQAAQPTTVGRRAAQWAFDLECAIRRVPELRENFTGRLRGLRGATGTQASYLSLLDEGERVDELEARAIPRIADWAFPPSWDESALDERAQKRIKWLEEERERMIAHNTPGGAEATERALKAAREETGAEQRRGLVTGLRTSSTFALVTQTYPRVVDTFILADLASTAAVLHKIATDIRLLSNRKELDEPFESKQIGSSAMPYKRNPMRCERICGLTRFVMNLVGNAYDTAATQWLERTLDDSSNRRLSLPEAFLALDGALDLMHNVASGLVVHEATVRKNLMAELPFMATENILMACVKLGADRQDYHERIRQHAQEAGMRVKQQGLDNDLLDRLRADPAFKSKANGGMLREELDWEGVMDPMNYIGRSVEQTERFVKEVVEPLREQYADAIAKLGESGPRV
ncbi:MAG: lyase family protein [Phycisphaerales bacterium JB054]